MKSAKLKFLPVIRGNGSKMVRITGWSNVAGRECLRGKYNRDAGPIMYSEGEALVVVLLDGTQMIINVGDVLTRRQLDEVIKAMKAAGERLHLVIESEKRHTHLITPSLGDVEGINLALAGIIEEIRMGKRAVTSISFSDNEGGAKGVSISTISLVHSMDGGDGRPTRKKITAKKLFETKLGLERRSPPVHPYKAEDVVVESKRVWEDGKERTVRI